MTWKLTQVALERFSCGHVKVALERCLCGPVKDLLSVWKVRESNLQFLQVPLIANNPTNDNVQVNEVRNDVNQTEVEENVTHTEKDVNEGDDNVTHTEVEVEVNETDVNVNQTEVPVSVPNFEMGNEAMNDNEAEIHENCETEAEVNSDSSEDSMRDVHFEGGEEERAIGADDGFTMVGMGHDEAEVDSDIRAEDNAGDASGVVDRAAKGASPRNCISLHANSQMRKPSCILHASLSMKSLPYSPSSFANMDRDFSNHSEEFGRTEKKDLGMKWKNSMKP
ncbi:hypothetical protein SESBI_40138 [Sesbania bispinosa]|nr:hypothetical protein SESBI_40138 [Sesbania bispinosa]